MYLFDAQVIAGTPPSMAVADASIRLLSCLYFRLDTFALYRVSLQVQAVASAVTVKSMQFTAVTACGRLTDRRRPRATTEGWLLRAYREVYL